MNEAKRCNIKCIHLAEEEIWIDEPLPCIPLEVRPINVMVTIGGRGRPRFRVETLISIYDEDEGGDVK